MIFVDTVAWLYLFDRSQNNNESRQAKQFVQTTEQAFCTSDLVIAETYNWLIHHGRPLHLALAAMQALVLEEIAIVLPVSDEDRHAALILLQKYGDQKLSYTDAMIVSQTTRYSIRQVFSFDKHFLLFPRLQRVPA